MTGSSKASQFWDADAPFASASLVEMQKSPGLEGPLEEVGSSCVPNLMSCSSAESLCSRLRCRVTLFGIEMHPGNGHVLLL